MSDDNSMKPSSIIYMLITESFWYKTTQDESDILPLKETKTGRVRCFRERLRLLEQANILASKLNEPMWVLSLDEHRIHSKILEETAPDGETDPVVYGVIPKKAIMSLTVLQRNANNNKYIWPIKR